MNTIIYKSIHHETALNAILNHLKQVDRNDIGANHVVIVPDRYTLSAERVIYPALSGKGSLNINVTTLARLWQKVGDSRSYISKFGAVMLMQRAVSMTELKYFHSAAGYTGFCQLMYSTVSQLISKKITPEMLQDACKDKGDTAALKLCDIAGIYSAYLSLAGSKYIDSSGLSALLSQKTEHHPYFKSSHFYIVGFDNLCKTELDLFSGIAKNSKSCIFAVAADLQDGTANSLAEILPACSIIDISDEMPPESLHVYRQIGKHNPLPFPLAAASPFKICAFSGIADEVSALAQSIVVDIDSGLRLKDIAVLMPRPELYSYALEKTLLKYNIPFYLPDSDTLDTHPVFSALTCLSRTVSDNCAAEDVLEFVKSAFFYRERSRCDLFENYCLKFGIDRSRFLQPFTLGDNEDSLDDAEAVRSQFNEFYTKLYKASKDGGISEALLGIANRLKEQGIDSEYTKALIDSGYTKQAQAAAQVITKLGLLTSQLLAIYPEADQNLNLFMTLLSVGAQSSSLSTVPVSADVVLCGDLDSARYTPVKKIYILGATEGDFPPVPDDIPLITPAISAKYTLLEDFTRQNYRELLRQHHKIRVLLSQAAQFVISYNAADSIAGTPAEYIGKLNTVFASAPQATLPLPPWPEEFKQDTLNVQLSMADKLFYRSGSTSVSSIETYFACPRKHFYRYGIKLKLREVAELLSLDRGSFLHGAIELFVKQYNTGDDAGALADKCFDAMLHDGQFARHLGSSRAESVFLKLRQEVIRTCAELAKQIDFSDFVPQKQLLEASFGQDGQLPPLKISTKGGTLTLGGKIDRIDIYDSGTASYARIIDYKSGNSQYAEKSLYFGSKVQLFIYMSVLKSAGYTPAGLYYFPIHDSYVKSLEKAYSLNGVTLATREILQATDNSADLGSGAVPALGIKFSMQADGDIKESKSLLNSSTLGHYLEYSQKLCRLAVFEILGGVNILSPAANACEYCEYTAVCGFFKQDEALQRSQSVGRDARRRIVENCGDI